MRTNSIAERNQSSSTKNEESNETKVPTTTATETENQSSYLSSSDEAAKSEDLKVSTNVESVSEKMNNYKDDDEREKDVEKFGGKIVYNPDGSAYIIDDDNEDDADDAVPALQGRFSVVSWDCICLSVTTNFPCYYGQW